MPEIQDIFLKHGENYRKHHKLPLHKLKVISAIEKCRTSALGSHSDECSECGYTKISYNSCRNRHCPKCQTLAKERWIDKQKSCLLNVGYFHVVFTIPDTLNTIAFQNQRILYNILFKSVAETLNELTLDKKYLGAKIGFTSILHTWGQNLMHHPHIHCIVPGGGVNALGQWVNSREKFFIPIKVLSRKFRGKFLFYIRQAKLEFWGTLSHLNNSDDFEKLLSSLYAKEWVVYCKPPFKSATFVVEYLGRYTHRIAISNSRIISIDDGKVSFRWRDYSDHSKSKVMTLSADEFMRRFLIHVLPPNFMKIRHYGILGNRNRNTKLKICKILTGTPLKLYTPKTTLDLIQKIIGKDPCLCPACGATKFGHFNTPVP